MKITKYEHAYLEVEEEGKKLIIDPGIYGNKLYNAKDISAVVITHMHADHLDITKLVAIHETSPDAKFFGTQEVADEIKGQVPLEVVTNGDAKDVGEFALEFFGTDHATIHGSLPVAQNVGVMVNNRLYYPGDSFTVPNKPVEILAAPAGSPWAKIGEEIDFVNAIKPQRVFPAHNAHLSEIGLQGRDRWLQQFAEQNNAVYAYLKVGESLEV